ncbi:hypothetical protein KDN24_07100 [Bacillus sp. Bva_UNVM-123]|uniref:hypothetical protein n=1 Tax=Bacillus sp. Bva_UNVM-123 TaxID=2829798 RepID=UPI00391F681C
MCLASTYLNELSKIQRKMQSDIAKISKKESEYDRKVSDIYHKIEISKFNACEGYYLSKELQDVLQKRRVIKHEGSRLRNIYKSLSLGSRIPQVQKSIEKTIKENKEYTSNFGISFSDIESEVLH